MIVATRATILTRIRSIAIPTIIVTIARTLGTVLTNITIVTRGIIQNITKNENITLMVTIPMILIVIMIIIIMAIFFDETNQKGGGTMHQEPVRAQHLRPYFPVFQKPDPIGLARMTVLVLLVTQNRMHM